LIFYTFAPLKSIPEMKSRYLLLFMFLSFAFCHPTAHGEGRSDTVTGTPPSGEVISLRECLKRSLENSPLIKTAILDKTRSHYSYRETVGAALPQVNFSGAWDDYLHLPTSLIPGEFFGRPGEMLPVQFGTNFNISAGLDVSQMLYNQSWLVALKMARQALQQQDLNQEQAGIEVVYQVAQAYYLTQITRRQVRNMESNLEQIRKAAKIAQSQYESGIIKKVDVDRIVIQQRNMETELDRLRVLYLQQLDMQKYFMGLSADKVISLDDSIPTASAPPTTTWNADNLIELRLIAKQKEMVNSGIRLEQAGYYPSLTLIGSMNYMNQSNTMYLLGKSNFWFNTSLVGIRLNVPLFSGLQRHYRVSQNKVNLEKLTVAEKDTREMLRINSADALRRLANSREAELSQRENVKLAERVFSISREQYSKGIIPLTDLLTAETALSDAQANHTYALVQMKLAELAYLKANGRLMEIAGDQVTK